MQNPSLFMEYFLASVTNNNNDKKKYKIFTFFKNFDNFLPSHCFFLPLTKLLIFYNLFLTSIYFNFSRKDNNKFCYKDSPLSSRL